MASVSRYNVLDDSVDEIPPDYTVVNQPHTTVDEHFQRKDCCALFADRVLFSKWYYALYVLIILTNCVLIIWLLVVLAQQRYSATAHWVFVLLDVVVNIAFLSEVGLQIASQKMDYFRHMSNLFDFLVMLLSLGTLFLYISKTNVVEEVEDLLALVLLGVRYVLQFLRLIAIIKKHKFKTAVQKEVDFNSLKAEDFHYMGGGNSSESLLSPSARYNSTNSTRSLLIQSSYVPAGSSPRASPTRTA